MKNQTHLLRQRRLYIFGQHHAKGWTLICLNLGLSATSNTLVEARDHLDQKIRTHLHLNLASRAGTRERNWQLLTWLRFFLCTWRLERSPRRLCEVVDLRPS
ncbi:MAG TPA: hypothetical protein PKE37_16855 [Thiomonas arsenitoxydans]|uniref:hypothetical protein n=1 Tax=Thiomonas arsenitoxydans (strain DSM 22701 / CIP 110005 / 3As) TaxID=426114 RepID=UPI002B822018|nr:hypothetical protein [Thiomonas arsenitoxydans]HML83422.1 hypothetical protein [Thiomonas arsenitoxydans]